MTDQERSTRFLAHRRTMALAVLLGWTRGMMDALGADRRIGPDTNMIMELDQWLLELRQQDLSDGTGS